jgi:type II secretory pathway pseudopilin PulG
MLWTVAVTLVVIGILLGAVAPLARGVWEAARWSATLTTLGTVARAAQLYADVTGSWPTGAADLQGRWIPPGAPVQTAWGAPVTLVPAGPRLDLAVSIPGPTRVAVSAWLLATGPGQYALTVPPASGHTRLRIERRRLGG